MEPTESLFPLDTGETDGEPGDTPLPQAERPRDQLIIERLRQQRTLQEIGDELGVTRERIKQIKNRLISRRGPDIIAPPSDRPLTIAEVAARLEVKAATVYHLVQSGQVPARKRGVRDWLIEPAQIELINTLLAGQAEPERTATCHHCQQPFTYQRTRSAKPRQYCSRACRTAHRQTRIPDPDAFSPWRQELQRQSVAQSAEDSPDEQYLTVTEAGAVTGLSTTQLQYLVTCGILTTVPHATLRWRGQPVMLYRWSDLQLAQAVATEYADESGITLGPAAEWQAMKGWERYQTRIARETSTR